MFSPNAILPRALSTLLLEARPSSALSLISDSKCPRSAPLASPACTTPRRQRNSARRLYPSKEAHSPLLLWLVATLQTSTPTRTVRRIWGSAVAQLQVWEAARSFVYCVRGGPLCPWCLMLCSSLFPDLAWVHVVDRTLTRVSGPCCGPKFNTLIHHENFLLKQI